MAAKVDLPHTSDRMEAYLTAVLCHPFGVSQGGRRDTLESFLETLSAALMEAHSSDRPSRFDLVRLHCSRDFQMVNTSWHDCAFPKAISVQEHLKNIDALKRANPDWKVHAYNFSASLEESYDHAIVWFTSGGTGGPGDWSTNRESVSRLYWRKRRTDGVWECYKHTCIRGPGNLFTEIQDHVVLPKDVTLLPTSSANR